jgi:two-component system, chemotaxis family, sensor kinase CheA
LSLSEEELQALIELANGRLYESLAEKLRCIRLPHLKNYLEKKVSNVFENVLKYFPEKMVELHFNCEDPRVSRELLKILDSCIPQLIRNSIDHGIEGTEERWSKNKEKSGLIEIESFVNNEILNIIVSDDGAGIDVEKLCVKVVDKKKKTKEELELLSDKEKMNLIFISGLSTARKISHISGRGVGLDVVKKAIDDVSGQIEVSSEAGIGTKFLIKIPL